MSDYKRVILIRFGELFLKGRNRHVFEKKLLENIKEKLNKYECLVTKIGNRYLISDYDYKIEKSLINNAKNVFGIHSLSNAVMIDSNIEKISKYFETIKIDNNKTFRVTVNRADKTFPKNSTEFSAYLGGIILKHNKVKVDLHNPDINVFVDIRENRKSFVFYNSIDALNGMPVGTSGKALLLLSGGIDSPVAGFLTAKRGMSVSAIHFHSYPYTSDMAREKVIKLANIISEYTGKIKIYICNFKEIQESIHKHCNEEYMITIMRRIMMRIAEKICKENGYQAIITGESLGQVASQTIESITSTNSVLDSIPVLRPLIMMDKSEITEIARKINTYETSILPYEDCCTVFLPENPIIKPKIEKVLKEEEKLDLDILIKNALNTIEIVETEY